VGGGVGSFFQCWHSKGGGVSEDHTLGELSLGTRRDGFGYMRGLQWPCIWGHSVRQQTCFLLLLIYPSLCGAIGYDSASFLIP